MTTNIWIDRDGEEWLDHGTKGLTSKKLNGSGVSHLSYHVVRNLCGPLKKKEPELRTLIIGGYDMRYNPKTKTIQYLSKINGCWQDSDVYTKDIVLGLAHLISNPHK